jgi:hypothetical protein
VADKHETRTDARGAKVSGQISTGSRTVQTQRGVSQGEKRQLDTWTKVGIIAGVVAAIAAVVALFLM